MEIAHLIQTQCWLIFALKWLSHNYHICSFHNICFRQRELYVSVKLKKSHKINNLLKVSMSYIVSTDLAIIISWNKHYISFTGSQNKCKIFPNCSIFFSVYWWHLKTILACSPQYWEPLFCINSVSTVFPLIQPASISAPRRPVWLCLLHGVLTNRGRATPVKPVTVVPPIMGYVKLERV